MSARRTRRKRRKQSPALLGVTPGPESLFVRADAHDVPLVPSRSGGSHQGIFYPGLALGPGVLSGRHAEQLRRFLVEVIRQRGEVLHLTNLWNALYFNYDLDHWGYHVDHIEHERIPVRGTNRRDLALPIGGFMRVHTETACGDLLAEVIYKEGADECVDAAWLDAAVSGAPASEEEMVGSDRVLVRRERYVIDLDAFGANGLRDQQLARLRERKLWLDERGHLLTPAYYRPEAAELDPLDHYADYLLREHRDGLLEFCFSQTVSDAELREALLRSFDAVRALLLEASELADWNGEYFFLRQAYAERLRGEGALGAADLKALYVGLRRLPNGSDRGYSAIGPRLAELTGRDSDDTVARTALEGRRYATAVCHANRYVAERLDEDQADGVGPDHVHLRLDDAREGGGIWRVERVVHAARYSLRCLSPLLALGLGYAEATPGEEALVNTQDEQPITESQTAFRVPLTVTDRGLGRLRLPADAAAALRDGSVDVVVRHGDHRWRGRVERDHRHLFGVEYPWEFYPGLVLHGNVENGGSVVRVRSVTAAPPIVARDGRRLDYDTDLGIYERDSGQQLREPERRGAPTLRALIVRAFRSAGQARPGGGRALTLSELTTLVLGPGWRAVESRPVAIVLATMDLERDGASYIWRPAQARARRTVDRSLLDLYGEESRLQHAVRRQWTPMHIRRFTEDSGRSPSAQKRASYAEARLKYGMRGVLPADLPNDCTWVKPSAWGAATATEPEYAGSLVDDSEQVPPIIG
jgi:hypothetical protein